MVSQGGKACIQRILSLNQLFPSVLLCCLQMAAKMGGDPMPNMNSSCPVIDPSLYGFGGQKRSLDNGGESIIFILFLDCVVFIIKHCKVV